MTGVQTCALPISYNMPGLFQVNARMNPAVVPGDAVAVRVIVGGKGSQDGVTMVVR